jgi:hypothetical protein
VCLSDRMKDEYITAFDDLATIEFDDNPATCRLVGNSDPPSPAPYEEDHFLGLRLDRGILVLSACHRDLNREASQERRRLCRRR